MIEWSDTDIIMRDTVREFIDKEIRPHLDGLESGELSPYPFARRLFSEFGLDVMAAEAVKSMLDKQREHDSRESRDKSGGIGALAEQASMAAVMVSELAGVSIGLLSTIGVSLGLGAATIMSRGTPAQKERWLPELMTLEKIAAWAITEPDAGSDAFGGMKTYVRRDGSDYILNGQKTFITNGPYADVLIVYAKLDDGDAATDRRDRPVLTFVLDAGMPGLTQGRPFKKMGMMSSPTGELFFDNVRIGPDRLLGETESHSGGDGRDSARANFAAERVGVALMSLGIINECHRLCLEYAKTRTLWGRKIAEFQLIQLKLARMEIARINVQNMVFQTLERLKAGALPTLSEASAIKLYSSEAATEVAMEAVQLFGGNGYMAEYRVEQLARDAKSLMIYAGSNEVQVTHIAKGLLAG
ncbi:acyl-CoA dehydrogenase family protein [Mycolicibacterium fortuitum]|uniref:Acyl-CoA dehydrogenase FadE n=2 Tax=Mycolicibacterium fortuitum TaxID=1766 RepID=A0A1A0SDZ3_MYCFO|nr:acyl-CoA dehydrogenase family protein [Mycolicibacterium fortuitum]AIY46254.1 Butyryl-CoA dehydrogenase [Mycobacterium sp. VKM Ac-1817D]CRL81199.1 acyl-CoA dehydrogenase FadE21 [Mycolicibacter nonchromogenicus]AMD54669.1 acyl-CoA dehydrogenase [Mycolicibacterium fortuitum subsp. fortuitum DSM 46621 = ATCC 6841 = JCM 6387]EJZ06596.1 acyl-CoA dehydrogenase FadE21 [Mycolicibacterium fortuitum subsp. fortuitum DSM 46621 = ATCC 6841 = JCM 6387]MCA4723470.1 acyl-CoA/acyl-ACP dehydrogenase [Mycoli